MEVPVSSAQGALREHEKPMSWARAMVIATGFFFVTAILLGQLPSYIYTVVTLSTLARMEQGFLDLALLALGIGMLCFELAFLYDPRPLIPWQLFAILGAGAGAVGTFFVYQVSVGINATDIFGFGGWSHFLPDAIQNGSSVIYWPNSGQPYLFNPIWFQPQSIDLVSVGMIAILTGAGMVSLAVLCPIALSGRLAGPLRDLLVRLSLGLSIVIAAVWLATYTFNPGAIMPSGGLHDPFANVLLFIALLLGLFALELWLLPIMIANRQQFMPAVYLHGVVGLIGSVAVPLLVIWAVIYPVVNAIHSVDSQQFWVECSQKTNIPGSCTFSPFTGQIICAIVFTNIFVLMMAGIYFWSTRRNTVVLGGTIGIIFVGLAVTIVHTDNPVQLPLGLIVAIGILTVAFVYTWATQREFASTAPAQLGCLGQWLVFGTLIMVFLFGYAFFSLPTFFELESGLAFFYQAGAGAIHDAFWIVLLMGGLIALQFVLLLRRQSTPMGMLRRVVLTASICSTVLLIAGAIIGASKDVLAGGVDALDGGSATSLAGLCFGLGAGLVALFGAVRARGIASPWPIAIVASALVGIAISYIAYALPAAWPDVVTFGFILATVGSYAFAVAGPDGPEYDLYYPTGANGALPAEGNGAVARQ
jgi:hypothetical protein